MQKSRRPGFLALTVMVLFHCASFPSVSDQSDATRNQREQAWAAGENFKARTAAIASSADGRVVYFHNDSAYARGSWFQPDVAFGATPKREFFRGRFYEVFYNQKLIGFILMNPLVFSAGGSWHTRQPKEVEAYRIVALSNPVHVARIISAVQPMQCETWEGGCAATNSGTTRTITAPSLDGDAIKNAQVADRMPFSFEDADWQDKALAYVQNQMDLIKVDPARFEAYFQGRYALDPYRNHGNGKKIPRE